MWKAALLLLLLAGAARAADVTVILDREPDAATLYLRMPAGESGAVLGREPRELAPGGAVDFDAMRTGTFDVADRVFSGVAARIGGRPAAFEGLSLMLHRPASGIPFADPLDAGMAISVCATPPPETPLALADLELVAGWYAHDADGLAEIALDLPATGRGAVTVDVREFVEGRPLRQRTMALPDGATLRLPPAEARAGPAALLALPAALAALLGLRARGLSR